MTSKILLALLLSTSLLLLTACGDSGGNNDKEPETPTNPSEPVPPVNPEPPTEPELPTEPVPPVNPEPPTEPELPTEPIDPQLPDELVLYYGDEPETLEIINDDPSLYTIKSNNTYIVKPLDPTDEMNNANLLLAVEIKGEGETTIDVIRQATDTEQEQVTTIPVTVNYAVFEQPRNQNPITNHDVNAVQMHYNQHDTIRYKYEARLINRSATETQCRDIETDEFDEFGERVVVEYCLEPGEQADLPADRFTITQENESNSDIHWIKSPALPRYFYYLMSPRWDTCEWNETQQTYLGYLNNPAYYSGNTACAFMYHEEQVSLVSLSPSGETYSEFISSFTAGHFAGYIENENIEDGSPVNIASNKSTLTYTRIDRNSADDSIRNVDKEMCEIWYNPQQGPIKMICIENIEEDIHYPVIELRINMNGVVPNP